MEKTDIESRMNVLRDSVKQNPNKRNNPDDKMCPFRDQVCNSNCKLFRANKPGYECPFQEVGSISWELHRFVKKMLS